MSDLISRQAAIDAARKCAVKEVTPAYMLIDKAEVMTELMKLPSAQPEEDCDTCKHGYFGDACCNNCKARFPSHYERRTDDSISD